MGIAESGDPGLLRLQRLETKEAFQVEHEKRGDQPGDEKNNHDARVTHAVISRPVIVIAFYERAPMEQEQAGLETVKWRAYDGEAIDAGFSRPERIRRSIACHGRLRGSTFRDQRPIA